MLRPSILFCTAILCALLSTPDICKADAVVKNQAMRASTIAEIFVDEGKVTLKLEIAPSDFGAFHTILPDALVEKAELEIPPLTQRLPHFLETGIRFQTPEGKLLTGTMTESGWRHRVQRDIITGEPVAIDNQEGVLFVTLEYPLEGSPEFLTIFAPKEDSRVRPANIGFMAYHLGLPVNDFRHLIGERKLLLDWNDPWYSKFEHKNFWREFIEPISAFLYVETFETRVEVVARIQDIAAEHDLGLDGSGTIKADHRETLLAHVAEVLAQKIDLTVDGEAVTPQLDRIHFIRRTLRASTVVEDGVDVEVPSAMVGAIYVHRTAALPDQAVLDWKWFSSKHPHVRAAATDEAGPLPFFLTPQHNELEWKNYLTNPTVPELVPIDPPVTTQPLPLPALSIALGIAALVALRVAPKPARPWTCCALIVAAVLTKDFGKVSVTSPVPTAPTIAEGKLAPTLDKLLHNIYVSFEFREEDAIYDKLARSVDGDLLADVYLETRKSLELENQGGAQVTIRNVEVVEAKEAPDASDGKVVATCKWNATGSVGHWGHIHQRTNQYDAKITLAVVDDTWKIVELKLLNENRIQ